jgi:hypothetical protein
MKDFASIKPDEPGVWMSEYSGVEADLQHTNRPSLAIGDSAMAIHHSFDSPG